MNRSTLKFLAVLLTVLIACVLFAGLDNLPRSVRAQIDSERAAVASARQQLTQSRDEVARVTASEQALFSGIAASREWPARFSQDESVLQSANRDIEELTRLEKANRRQDRQRAEALLAHARGLRTNAVADATAVKKDADHWVEMKKRLPEEVQAMERDYNAVHGLDLAPVAAAVDKAETDWPQKKADLDSRLATLKSSLARDEEVWQQSAASRKAAATNDYAHVDYTSLFGAADTLHTSATELPAKAAEVKALSGQLYNAWDKVLVDMEVRGIGTDKSYDQKIRTVTTHVPNASAQTGEITSDEKWVVVSPDVFKAQQNNLGMAIAHKSAGQYDVEAERVPQPAGFAYVAPPSQGSNQYGHWEHRDGHDFWVFYGQYALLRDLLWNHSYRPPDRYEWDNYYSSRRNNQTYYGRDEAAGAPKYGTQGSATQDRYSGSTFGRSGGFRDSQYASKSGSYRDSRFATPGARPGADNSPRSFGSGSRSRPEQPHAAPPPIRSYRPPPSRPSPRPSFRPPSSGRSFGRRR